LLPEDDLGIETCWSDFKCFSVKFYVCALVGMLIKLINMHSYLPFKSCILMSDDGPYGPKYVALLIILLKVRGVGQ